MSFENKEINRTFLLTSQLSRLHIFNRLGAIIQSSLSEDQSKQHAALISSLTEKASLLIQTLDPDDDLNFLRIRSKKKEIMVAPDNGFLMMVIQNPNAVE